MEKKNHRTEAGKQTIFSNSSFPEARKAFDAMLPVLLFSSSIGLGIFLRHKLKEDKTSYQKHDAPEWLHCLFEAPYIRVLYQEWEEEGWRRDNGWKGNDLIHSGRSGAVFIPAYFWNKAAQELTGIVTFGPNCESHRGLCHGGAMTSVMDDLLGHIAFIGGSAPWLGATVQVNTKLSKPVHVGQTLSVVGKITALERKKVFVTAKLIDEKGAVYAEMDGISIKGVNINAWQTDDDVSKRGWDLDETKRELRTSGWCD
jgi:acyl-coenzyme A thioesterase PaaI-like protein